MTTLAAGRFAVPLLAATLAGGVAFAQTAAAQTAAAQTSAAQTAAPGARDDEQPTRDQTNRLMRQNGIAPSAEQSRDQLRTLNELDRKLLPNDPSVPAPGVQSRPR